MMKFINSGYLLHFKVPKKKTSLNQEFPCKMGALLYDDCLAQFQYFPQATEILYWEK